LKEIIYQSSYILIENYNQEQWLIKTGTQLPNLPGAAGKKPLHNMYKCMVKGLRLQTFNSKLCAADREFTGSRPQ